MEHTSIVDLYNPTPHLGAPITAAAFDAQSGAAITADAWGIVAVIRPGERLPNLVFQATDAVYGAVAIAEGGALVAVGDEQGTIAVYKTWDGACVFHDIREGDEGRARAMRAVSFNPAGTMVATLSVDGIIRVFDVGRWERVLNWSGFSGESIAFDPRGERILAIDTLSQVKLLDTLTQEQLDLEMVPGGVQVARFTPDGEHVVTMGMGGVSIIRLPEGNIVNSFSARGSSGMLNIVMSPDGTELAAVTARSLHRFSLPGLEPVGSDQHGAPEPTNAALWDYRGVAVGGADGMLYRPDAKPSLDEVVCVGGFGEHRIAAHGSRLALWTKTRQKRPFKLTKNLIEVRIDRDGRLVVGIPDDNTGVQVYEAKTGRFLFDAGPETANSAKIDVGGAVVAVMLNGGGVRWYELQANQVLELPWVRHFALSGSGTWLGAVTPKGQVKIIDPKTGQDAIPAPVPLAEVPIQLISFVNRSPHLLVLDQEGVLGLYDLTESVTENKPARGQDIFELNVPADRLWGITGGRYAALRIQEEDGTATVIFVDLETSEVASEVTGLLPYAWVDPETGSILQPARGGALLETDMYGLERRVFRALPEGQWVCFGPDGVIDHSEQAVL
ncbi:MAG: hypothetical protein JXX28_01745 [Deltaproteobacteria bacterium]|nr:hypothetical protein [Deltaproteobacteria bacterium]